MNVYQIQFIEPKWGGKEYEVVDNFRTFKKYEDACRILDSMGTAIFQHLTDTFGGNIECREDRDKPQNGIGDGLLRCISFFTKTPTLDNIVGFVVEIEVEDEFPKPVEEVPTEKTYRVELWYNYHREVKITAMSEDEALDAAREMPITHTSLINSIQEVDSYVEEVKD